MSMKTTGCSGYTVKASELTKLLALDHQDPYKELLEAWDYEEIQVFLDTNLPAEYPRPESVFILGEENQSDDLEIGEIYVIFALADLYILMPTPQLKELITHEISPIFTTWASIC